METLDIILEKFANEEVRRETLENGLTVILKENHAAEVVSAQVWVKTGSIHESQFLGSGISHYVEHMLFKGTTNRTYQAISEDIQRTGGSINAYTTFDRTVYYVNGIIEGLEPSLDVLADIVFNSTIDEQEAIKERDVILREIDMGLDDPDRELSQCIFKTAFHKHPYRYPVIGDKALFQQITREELLHYYKSRYVPNNMVVVIVGAMATDEMMELVKKHFGNAQPKYLQPILIEEENIQISDRVIRKSGDYEIVRGGMVFKTPGLEHPDTPGLGVLANMLGQGQSSFLWKLLREEKKLVHYINTSIWNPYKTGLFWIGYSCDKGKRAEVEEAIMDALFDFQLEGVPQENIDKAIRQAMVNEVNNRKTMNGQAQKLGLAEVVVGDIDFSRIFIEKLKAVTPEDVANLHAEYLIDAKRTLVSLETKDETKSEKNATTKSSALADFEEIFFENGTRIIFQQHAALPKINIRILFHGGPLYEAAEKRGICGVLSSMLTKDTHKRNVHEVAEAIESIGGVFREFSGNNSFGLMLEVLPQDLELGVDILKEALIEPRFNESSFQVEKDAQIAAIREEIDDVASHGFRDLRKKFFGDYPYSSDPLGSIETLESLTLEDIQDYQEKLINTGSMVISVSGDIEKERLLDLFSWVEHFPKGEAPEPLAQHFGGPTAGEYTKPLDREQVVVFDAYPGIGVQNTEEIEAAEIINEMLSGMTSRLFVKVREEQGLAYFVGSNLMIGRDTGIFYLYGGTNPEHYTTVFKEFDAEIERLIAGEINDEELHRCKIHLKATHISSLQAPASRAMIAGLDALYGLNINRWRTYAKRIEQVSKSDIQRFAQKHFSRSKKVRFAIGNLKDK